MFCGNCGHKIGEVQGGFCPNCGAKAGGGAPQAAQSQGKAKPAAKGVSKRAVMIVSIALLTVIIGVGGFFIFRAFTGPSVGDIIEFGGIEWRVLDVQGGQTLVISEYILERMAYHTRLEGVTWENSAIRQYLNGEFLVRFTAEERDRIAETRVINDDNPWFGTNGGADTIDRVFLLSLDELVQYFGDSGQLGNQNHPNNEWWGFSDRFDEDRIANELNDGALWWWLRSRGGSAVFAASVDDVGYVLVYGDIVDHSNGGVRPALWLNR